jgi:hypothetical protein
MFRTCLIGLILSAFACPAGAYYISWEGDCLPEEAGWTRFWGDDSGPYHGSGAARTIYDGVMTMDSLYDISVFDFVHMDRSLNPTPGEMFFLEWRLAVDQVIGGADPAITVSTGYSAVGFQFTDSEVEGAYDHSLHIDVSPAEFHEYRITSWDMQAYDLFVDGALVYHGAFLGGPGGDSYVAWGDGAQGAASLHRWDYVRFGTVPEPGTALLTCLCFAYSARVRRVSCAVLVRRWR